MCRYYETFWDDTQRLQVRSVTTPILQQSVFPRIEAWRKKQPPLSSRRKCKCGSNDQFLCWLHTQHDELMGARRR